MPCLSRPLLLVLAATLMPACGEASPREQGQDDAGADSSATDTGLPTPASTTNAEAGASEEGDADAGRLDVAAGTGADGGQAEGPIGCMEFNIEATNEPSNVMLVLDHSISMNSSFGADSRWAALHDAVAFLVDEYDDRMHLGATIYPDLSAPLDGCDTELVDVPVMPMGGAEVLAALPPRDAETTGNTPTQLGIELAAGHLETLDPTIERVMILVTDGLPSCPPGAADPNTLDRTVDEAIRTIRTDRDIPTYVLGIALGGGATTVLNQMAAAGGRVNPGGLPLYYPANSAAELREAFDQIAGDVISCTLELQIPPTDPSLVEITVDGSEVPAIDSCSDGSGWHYVDGAEVTTIELCGAACDTFKDTGIAAGVQRCPPPG